MNGSTRVNTGVDKGEKGDFVVSRPQLACFMLQTFCTHNAEQSLLAPRLIRSVGNGRQCVSLWSCVKEGRWSCFEMTLEFEVESEKRKK